MERWSVSANYAKFLLCQDLRADARRTQTRIFRLGMFPPSTDTIEFLREELRPPRNFMPETTRHEASVRFLKQEGIYGLFHPDKYDRQALALLHKSVVKEAAEAWLLTGAPYAGAAEFLKNTFGEAFDPIAIERYVWYCFNLHKIQPSEWPGIFRRYHSQWGEGDVEDDIRWRAVSGSNDKATRIMLRTYYGKKVANTDFDEAIRDGATTIANAIAAKSQDPRVTMQDLNIGAQGMRHIKEAYEMSRSVDADWLANVERAKLKQHDDKIVMVHELSQGNHSTELVNQEEESRVVVPIDAEFIDDGDE